MTGRELAWRVLVNEVRASSGEEKGSGEKTPSYLISPLGARMNRILVTGSITPPDPAGTGPAGFARARLTDATGTLPVTAGSYQPLGRADLERLTEPTRAFVVGKVAWNRNSVPSPDVSLRAEAVHPVTDPEYRSLLAESAAQTLERLRLVLRLRGSSPPNDTELHRQGISPHWIRGARTAVAQYPAFDAEPYYESLRAVLLSLRAPPTPERAPPSMPVPNQTASEVVRSVRARAIPDRPSLTAGLKALEGRLLEIVDELAEASPDGYADMDELAERAARHGLEGERMEELLNYLSEMGTLEEPLVGKFRRVEGPPRGENPEGFR